MAKRYVDEGELASLAAAVKSREGYRALIRWVQRQPTAPRLVGATAAARMLGVRPPHLARLRKQGRMPEPIPIEGSADVYIYEEVQALAQRLTQEREEREERRRAREAAA